MNLTNSKKFHTSWVAKVQIGEETENQPENTNLLSFPGTWHFYTFIMYLSMHMPYYFGRDSLNQYVVKSSKLQKIFRFTLIVPLMVFFHLTDIGSYGGDLLINLKKSPKTYFKLVGFSFTKCRAVTLLTILNFAPGKFHRFIKTVSKINLLKWTMCTPAAKFGVGYLMISIALCVIIPITMLVYPLPYTTSDLASIDRWHALVEALQWRFFQDVNTTRANYSTPVYITFGTLELMLELMESLDMVMSYSLFYGLVPCSFWAAVTNFNGAISQYAKRRGPLTKEEQRMIIFYYKELLGFAKSLKSVWSVVVFLTMLEQYIDVTFYNMENALKAVDTFAIVVVAWRSFSYAFTLILFAEGYRKMTCFKMWLEEKENIYGPHGNEYGLETLIKEINRAPVGIGITGLYQPNYGFVGALLVFFTTTFMLSLMD